MKKIDENLTKVLEFIKREVKTRGCPPTYRDIGAEIGVTSTSTINYYMNELEKNGLIKKSKNKKRAIEIIKSDEDEVSENNVRIPCIGKVTAGIPILASQIYTNSFEFSKSLFTGENLFILNVSGDSMIDAGIINGDMVVVNQQNTAENGDIVVALIDDSATVKTFYKEKNAIRLQPQNPFYEPIISPDIVILGKVIGVVRKV